MSIYPDEDEEEGGSWIPDEDGWITLGKIVRVEPGSPWVSFKVRMPTEREQKGLLVSCDVETRQLFIGLDRRATHWAVLCDP